MTNREYLRNLLTQLAGELATLRPTSFEGIAGDANALAESIIAANNELDALDAEKIEEAQKRWFSVRGPGAALIRVDNARTIEVKQSPVKAKTIPATTMTRFTLRDGSQEAA